MAQMILLVDDDRDLVESLSQVLKTRGYGVTAAYSAAEGLRALPRVNPDLIIMDVMMETDTAGFEAVGQIRSPRPDSRFAAFRLRPIIILTAIGQVTNSRFSLDPADNFLPGVEEFLTKPVDIDALLSAAARLLA
jgi:CheY-like chemotaxis protein